MRRNVVHRTLVLFSFVLFLLCPLVMSQLSSNQRSTMFTLSQLLNNTILSWDVNKDPCSWKGVTCSPDNSSITQISLSGFGVSSSGILPVICQIDSLQSLDLSNNHFSSIPDEFFKVCGGISGLRLLNVSRNRLFSSLPSFDTFVGLKFLDLSHNYMNGNISLQLNELVALTSLNLSYNNFSGTIPTSLGKSKALEQLELSANCFDGAIPQEIADYGNLSFIDLSGNRLSGSIPDRIGGSLSKLDTLILSSNNLGGRIPSTLSNITTLSRFAANQNQFVGTIPTGITRFLRNLDLSYNLLSGSIPSDLLSPTNFLSLDLSYNNLEGSIPANISQSLFRLRLGSNSLNGVLPSTVFATLDRLMYLELDNNGFTGEVPAELSVCKGLALLNLAQNELTGVVPVQLSNLSNLEVIKLQSNKLVGGIPAEFSKLKTLSVLNISWNFLNGSIPSSISGLQSLMNLNLQGNNLSGSIPDTIGDMNSLIELQVGQNQLSGRIPIMPLNLQIALNLSSNLFNGTIPSNLARLTNLEVLDLSNNKFSGGIPEFLTQMGSLTQLILSNNQLSGVIPTFKDYVVVSKSGNPGLINATRANNSPESTKKKKSIAVAVAIALISAVVAVVVGTIIALSISRHYYRVNVEQFQSEEDLSLPQVVQGNLLTANGIHRSNIDFMKAMEAVANPLNISLKTRFSTYYRAIMPSGTSYFVKKLNWSDKIFQSGSHEKFEQELEVLGKLNNTNVMTPLGYILTVDSAYLIYEYAQKGTLHSVLHDSLDNVLDWASRYSIAVGVAQALAFLHGCTSGPILLLDLSSKSVLLKSLKEPQVGDIELCKVIDPSKSTGSLSTVAGSVGYIPPEYAYTMRVTMAGNVYSFGVVLLELLTGKPAVSEGTELAKWTISTSRQQGKLDHILDFNVGRMSPAVKSQMLAVLKIAISCVSVSPEARPKMKSVLRMLLNAR
ncbi:LRR_1 domain-containing protein/Pkinase_Tyr domain-containing protein/LRRNT_2 domain-containing protein/LRR_8 domain-containing protein [Cephalotus follicularis]|uniref:non-specific serine/threonine protein kinase n=1 Tax=Cephalotus follicularis TaxID=3775 RepID=A0A1Q3BC10_CEPFO|nr:LRR_1 domain-containing protein/Pkinase_Tyr domain-containing protein/LRRNT_2 domain-containing protein/LRR_8 domain-containing protein [Cephalotus follicularis]